MIVFDSISAKIKSSDSLTLADATITIPSNRRIALVGTSAHETKLIIGLLSGLIQPHSGRVVRHARVSFPVGYQGGMARDLSLRANTKLIAKLYDADTTALVNFVRTQGRLARFFEHPLREVTASVRDHFAYVLAYGIPFDTYVLAHDFSAAKTDAARSQLGYELFEARQHTSGVIVPTNNRQFASEFCDIGLVLHQGHLLQCAEMQDAFAIADEILARRQTEKLARQEEAAATKAAAMELRTRQKIARQKEAAAAKAAVREANAKRQKAYQDNPEQFGSRAANTNVLDGPPRLDKKKKSKWRFLFRD